MYRCECVCFERARSCARVRDTCVCLLSLNFKYCEKVSNSNWILFDSSNLNDNCWRRTEAMRLRCLLCEFFSLGTTSLEIKRRTGMACSINIDLIEIQFILHCIRKHTHAQTNESKHTHTVRHRQRKLEQQRKNMSRIFECSTQSKYACIKDFTAELCMPIAVVVTYTSNVYCKHSLDDVFSLPPSLSLSLLLLLQRCCFIVVVECFNTNIWNMCCAERVAVAVRELRTEDTGYDNDTQ